MHIQDDKFASYKLLAKALQEKGYTTKVEEGELTSVSYTSPTGKVWSTKGEHIAYPFTSDAARHISVNKEKAYRFADKLDFPTPYTVHITDSIPRDEELLGLIDKFTKLIVKPADLSLSKGLTINVDSLSRLNDAITYAQSFSSSTLIQEQVEGEEIRFTVIDGKVKVALLRQTARVIGDGYSSIAELIKGENTQRRLLHFDSIVYPELDKTIIEPSILSSNVVPENDEMVELSRSTMVRGGCSIYDILPYINESYVHLVENLVAELDAGFIVVDIFCRSYTAPAVVGNYWLIEFNTAPVLKLYYACRDGKQFDIVDSLAGAIDQWLHASQPQDPLVAA